MDIITDRIKLEEIMFGNDEKGNYIKYKDWGLKYHYKTMEGMRRALSKAIRHVKCGIYVEMSVRNMYHYHSA
jgi:hypothetical protein